MIGSKREENASTDVKAPVGTAGKPARAEDVNAPGKTSGKREETAAGQPVRAEDVKASDDHSPKPDPDPTSNVANSNTNAIQVFSTSDPAEPAHVYREELRQKGNSEPQADGSVKK